MSRTAPHGSSWCVVVGIIIVAAAATADPRANPATAFGNARSGVIINGKITVKLPTQLFAINIKVTQVLSDAGRIIAHAVRHQFKAA